MWTALKNELTSFTWTQKRFILSAMLCGFFISAEYAIVRPVSNSVFIHAYGSSLFPYAWLATIPLNLLLVSLYNRFLPRLGCLRMCCIILALAMSGSVVSVFFLKKISSLPFIFYVWKEVYVMLLFQQLWSVIHSTIEMRRAKYLYGVLFGIGAVGAVLGSMLPGFFAIQMGSENLLLLTIPIYFCVLFFYRATVKHSALSQVEAPFKNDLSDSTNSFFDGFKLIAASPLLFFILLIVMLMQLSAAIVDFQFNTVLERTIGDKDVRTEYFGRIHGLIQTATIALQLFGTFLIVHYLGLKRSHLFVPIALCLNALAFMCFPVFGIISFSYITIKAFDFSIFGVIKEMLYVPLKLDEKFRAKAIIDVFAHRSSKAVAAMLVIFLQTFFQAHLISFLSWSAILIFIGWCIAAQRLLQTGTSSYRVP